jgi:hypothetical protein
VQIPPYAKIERAARSLMVAGERPTVRKVPGRCSPNRIVTCMQRFWKNQAAINQGDPVALTRLPPKLADAAIAVGAGAAPYMTRK